MSSTQPSEPHALHEPVIELPAARRAGKDLSPNMRAIRLTMRVAELQLARGVGARDVVLQSLDITETYCERRVWFDVVGSLVLASQDRGHDREPLTMIRTVVTVAQNNMLVQDLQALVKDIVDGLPLAAAEARLDQIVSADRSSPVWLRMLGFAGVGAGYALLFSASWVLILVTFLLGCLVDQVMRLLNRYGAPPFFVQAAASLVITLVAVGVGELGEHGVPPFTDVSPTLVVVAGVVALVAGLTIYATATDAIDEFFITAGARFFKTFMMTAGIVAGILVGITVAQAWGSTVAVALEPVPLGPIPLSLLGAVLTAVAWAVYTQGSRSALLWAGVVSGLGWLAYLATMGWDDLAAKAIAALVIGSAAAVVTRLGKTTTIAIVDAAVVALVPGLALLMGLMRFTGQPTLQSFYLGWQLLLTALGVAIAIAAGAALGAVVGRPVRSHLRRVRTAIPLVPTLRRTRPRDSRQQ